MYVVEYLCGLQVANKIDEAFTYDIYYNVLYTDRKMFGKGGEGEGGGLISIPTFLFFILLSFISKRFCGLASSLSHFFSVS